MAHVPHLYLPGPWREARLPVSDEQQHHVGRVLRLRDGDPVSYTDGAGRMGEGRFVGTEVVRGEESERERPSVLTVAVSPPRSRDRARFLVEKLAELGVATLVWFQAHHGEGRPPSISKTEAWSVAALEQSRGAWLMDTTEGRLEDLNGGSLVVAHPDGADAFPAGASTLVVGPEGGFAPGEIPEEIPRVSLGPTILRVETAAVVGAALMRASASR